MAGNKKTEASVAVAADVQPSSADIEVQPTEAVESTQEDVLSTPYQVVVWAYAGTEELMRRVWKKFCSLPLVVKTVEFENDAFSALLTLAIADNEVADEFVMVMPNTIPCDGVLAELYIPTVLVDSKGEAHYNHRLPMVINKAAAVELLGQCAPIESQEEFIKAYAKEHWGRPVQVSMHFGNYVTSVLRGTPCINAVTEGLIRRKFVSANAVGFAAIEKLLEQVLL